MDHYCFVIPVSGEGVNSSIIMIEVDDGVNSRSYQLPYVRTNRPEVSSVFQEVLRSLGVDPGLGLGPFHSDLEGFRVLPDEHFPIVSSVIWKVNSGNLLELTLPKGRGGVSRKFVAIPVNEDPVYRMYDALSGFVVNCALPDILEQEE